MTAIDQRLKIGISVGDINGIGLEVVLKTLADKRLLDWCIPIIYGSTKVVSYHKNIANIKDLPIHNTSDVQSLNPDSVNVINCWMENVKITLGKCTAEGGKYATFSLDQATEDLKAGFLDAIVTAPIHKKAMQESGFAFPGHTEYLTSKFQSPLNLMLLVNESLRVGLVTNHLPLSEVASTINSKLVLDKIRLMDKTLRMDFGLDRPAIAVLGLNPHAGDGGVLGTEELEHILPAIEKAKAEGILAIGPYAADGFFGSGNYTNFDGILAMYHDQGLVPFKALSFGKGINFTAGLPIIRTSPDHGTGFDIAGKNIADYRSFREALYLALDSARQRADYLHMHDNPLSEIVNETGEDEILEDEDQAQDVAKRKQQGSKNQRDRQDRNKRQKPARKEEQPKPQATEESTDQKKSAPDSRSLTIEERLALAAEKRAHEKAAAEQETAKQQPTPIPDTNKTATEEDATGVIEPVLPTEEVLDTPTPDQDDSNEEPTTKDGE